MPTLYHYTSGRHLHAIGKYGLTVGDVPTDLVAGKGRVGVWLTTDPNPDGHGLKSSAAEKTRYRLTVDVPEKSPLLSKWTDWAPSNATEETVRRLHATASGFESWYVYFGIVHLPMIISCEDTKTAARISNWAEKFPVDPEIKPIPSWRRDAWHKRLLKNVEKAVRR
jgi:hypothetical protein